MKHNRPVRDMPTGTEPALDRHFRAPSVADSDGAWSTPKEFEGNIGSHLLPLLTVRHH